MLQSIPHEQRLREFVTANFYVPDPKALDSSTSFLESGIIDSTGVLELVTFVESEFGVAIADDELVPANFDSITAIARFVERKRGHHGVLAR
jgi:acyl carrier protein